MRRVHSAAIERWNRVHAIGKLLSLGSNFSSTDVEYADHPQQRPFQERSGVCFANKFEMDTLGMFHAEMISCVAETNT
jgi:hypothetical protein